MKRETKRLLINIGITAAVGLCAAGVGYLVGRRSGESRLAEELIHNYESGKNDGPVYVSSDKNLGNLMYELYAECIGD